MEENNQTPPKAENSNVEVSQVDSSKGNQTNPPANKPFVHKSLLIIFGVIVGIMVLLIAAFFALNWYTRNQEIIPSGIVGMPTMSATKSKPTPDPTANWKTYKNTYNPADEYSFKYPPGLVSFDGGILGDLSDPTGPDVFVNRIKLKNGNNPGMIIEELNAPKDNKIQITNSDCKLGKNSTFNSFEGLVNILYSNNTNKNCPTFNSIKSSLKEGKFQNRYKSFEFTVNSGKIDGVYGGSAIPNSNIRYLIFEKDNSYFVISYDSNVKIFDQILSNFKFINSDTNTKNNSTVDISCKQDSDCMISDINSNHCCLDYSSANAIAVNSSWASRQPGFQKFCNMLCIQSVAQSHQDYSAICKNSICQKVKN